MWKWRLFGAALAAGGASVMAFLWSQVMDRSNQTLFIHRVGIPGDLLLAMLAVCSVLVGLHLALKPRPALRRAAGPVRRA